MSDATNPRREPSSDGGKAIDVAAVEHVREALRGLRFGVVTIIVQDGVVVQLERTERKRLR